jgi:RHS repeat-associated protein
MCPSVAVMGGGGGSGGGGGGSGGDGDGSANGDGSGNGADASGDGKNGGQGCGDPVCPITGRVFLEMYDFGFAGPQPLRWLRHYNSRESHLCGELGFGWTHSYGWWLRERRDAVEVFDDGLRRQIFALPPEGGAAVDHPLGYRLSRSAEGFVLLDRDGTRRVFGPPDEDGVARLLSVSDRNGNTTKLERDPEGRLTGMVDSAGRPYRVINDASGRIERVLVAEDAARTTWLELVRYVYDDAGNLASATDAEGFSVKHDYAGHLLVAHRSPSGPTYRWVYDGPASDARCIETWGDEDGVMPGAVLDDPSARGTAKGIFYQRFSYGPDFYTEVDDGLGGRRRYFGDATGRVVKEITPSGGVITRSFDPKSGVQRSEARADGREAEAVVHGTKPIGYTSNAGDGIGGVVDPEGFVVSIYEKPDSPPAVVRRRFDEHGNLRVVIHHDGARESFDVDDRGLVSRHFDRLGAVTQYFHDAQGNCTAIVRPGGRTEHLEYDYLGRLVRHVDAAGRETTWRWDRRSEIVEKKVAGGTYRMQYNAARKVTVLDENGRVTRFSYGGQDWIVRIDEPAGNVTQFRYDAHGRLVRLENGRGQVFTERYDYAGRRVGWTTFEGVEYTATYDAMERVTSVRDPLGRVVWSYDESSRLEGLSFNDGTTVEMGYEGRGGPAKMAGTVVPVERYLDAFGRLHGEKMGEHTLHVTWNAGAPTKLESDVGLPISYEYDELGDLSTVRVGSHGRVVDRPSGGDLLTSLGDRLVMRRRYGARGELLFQSLGKRMMGLADEDVALPGMPGTIFFAEYEYDASLNLLAEKRSDGSTTRMELTPNGQVARRTRMDRLGKTLFDEELGYDGAGSPRVIGALYDAVGRPKAYRGESFTYDALGRLSTRTTDRGTFRYEWNGLDQLVRVTAPDRIVEMDYDARGRRIRKRVYRQRELVKKIAYVWNNNLVVHEVDELSGATRTYDRIDGSWLTFGHVDRAGSEERSVHYVLDPVGCVDFAVDRDGQIVWEADRTTYGHCEPRESGAGAPVDVTARLPNQFWDVDVELAYTWHRWYDARLGLFVSTDPLFLEGNQNPRDYAANPLNPINGIDPTGWHVVPPAATNLAQPGPHAGPHPGPGVAQPGCVPCPPNMFRRRGRPNAAVQQAIDNAGAAHGCHSCGASSPGTASGHWIGDHQPPLSTFGPGGPPAGANIWLYPHCAGCSPRQGGFMSHHAQAIGPGLALAANPPPSAA